MSRGPLQEVAFVSFCITSQMSSKLTRLHCRDENVWADVPTECCEAFRGGEQVSMRWRHAEANGATLQELPPSPQLFLRGSVLHIDGTRMLVSASGLLAQISTHLHERGGGGDAKDGASPPSIGDEVTLRIFGETSETADDAAPKKKNQSRQEPARVTRRSTK